MTTENNLVFFKFALKVSVMLSNGSHVQVKAFGPGLEPTGVTVNKSTQFTVDAREAGKGGLKIYAQVCPNLICSKVFSVDKLVLPVESGQI